MKILSVKNNKTDATFEVEFEQAKWKKLFANAKQDLAKNIQIQGFRKGHVPQAEIDRRISNEEVAMRALNSNQNQIVQEVMSCKEFKDSNCIDSVSKMEITKLLPLPVVKISFELLPKVENFKESDIENIVLPAYKKPDVPDAVVKNQIKMMIKPDAMVSVKQDGIVAKGNIAVIDFKGFVDNKPFNGGEGKDYELEIGSKSFIDNFEDQLIGCKKGDKKDVNVTFPQNYGAKDLAGKKAKFEVLVKEVKEIEYPEITKQYCQKFAMDCANMAELEKHIRDLYEQETLTRYQDAAMRIVNDEIIKKAKLSHLPTGLLNLHKNQILRQYEQEAKNAGFSNLDQYKKAIKLTNDQFEQTLNDSANKTLTVTLAYEKLIDDYKLKVSSEDSKQYLDKLTRYLGDEKKAKDMYEKNKDYAQSTILREKLFKKIIAECKKESK